MSHTNDEQVTRIFVAGVEGFEKVISENRPISKSIVGRILVSILCHKALVNPMIGTQVVP